MKLETAYLYSFAEARQKPLVCFVHVTNQRAETESDLEKVTEGLRLKLRESGMPEEAYWESLFDVRTILDRLEVDASLKDVVEFGCGYGTFTLPVAQRIAGVITTTDIDPDMVARTFRRAKYEGLSNVVCRVADVLRDGFGVAPESQDACLLFNILHCEDPVGLLTRGVKTVRQGGTVFVIHWRHDPTTPRGPSMAIRPIPESVVAWAEETHLLRRSSEVLGLPPWHYGIRFSRQKINSRW